MINTLIAALVNGKKKLKLRDAITKGQTTPFKKKGSMDL